MGNTIKGISQEQVPFDIKGHHPSAKSVELLSTSSKRSFFHIPLLYHQNQPPYRHISDHFTQPTPHHSQTWSAHSKSP
jgi:hypothetical protein